MIYLYVPNFLFFLWLKVLRTLARYVRRRDLLRYRQVCKKFNKSVISRVRKEFYVRLDEASLGKYSSLSQFLSLLLSSDPIPYGSYLFLNLKLGNPLLQKLFTICGSLIKALRIELSHFDILDIYGLRELLLHRAPNLQILSLEGCLPEEVISFPKFLSTIVGCKCNEMNSSSRNVPILPNIQELFVEGRKMHPNFLVDLLRSCPNLKRLKSNKNWGLDRSTLIISAVRDSGNFKNLNALHLNDVDGSHMNILLTLSLKGMRLEEFSFKILDSVDNNSFQGLINCHHESLRELSFGEVTGSQDNLVLNFPIMKNLRKLSRVAVCKPEIVLGPFCFATVTPNLEELIVQTFADEVQWEEYFADVNVLYPCHSLRKLALPTNLSDTLKLVKLGKMFPNVQNITADSPRNSIISQLWTMWPELQELCLTLSDKNDGVDSIFTGIPETTCDLINLSKSFDEVDIETVRVGPSISNLRGVFLYTYAKLYNLMTLI